MKYNRNKWMIIKIRKMTRNKKRKTKRMRNLIRKMVIFL